MKVRVKTDKSGFIYGRLYTSGQEFTLKPVEKSTVEDKDGNPVIVPVEQQFSKIWMEKVNAPKVVKEVKEPSKMKIPELKVALADAEIELPAEYKKADLVSLLEAHQEAEAA